MPGAGNLIKRSLQVYKSRFLTLFGLMLLPASVGIFSYGLEAASKSLSPIFSIFLPIVFLIAGLILTFWASVALLFAVKEREAKIGIKRSLQMGRHKIISYWWVSTLSVLIIGAGVLLFIIPGIIFAVWLSLAGCVLVAEVLRGMKALSRSKQLVAGHWRGVFWRFSAMGFFLIAVILPITFISAVLKAPLLQNILTSALNLFITPFIYIFIFLLYEDLKKLKVAAPGILTF